ncbi:unnamed protein product [Prorocentrum cordatum]|uniref:Uncharacterized protein n=1 Tax=Prorocentrum cordatum TaxID=2364126 RepID=A0ABN9RBN2_9DINO|nr:unnamed protein product [Polarella glacialis]
MNIRERVSELAAYANAAAVSTVEKVHGAAAAEAFFEKVRVDPAVLQLLQDAVERKKGEFIGARLEVQLLAVWLTRLWFNCDGGVGRVQTTYREESGGDMAEGRGLDVVAFQRAPKQCAVKQSSRASRRAVAEYYSANCLAFSVGSRALWYLSAAPSNCALRAFICDALENYLAPLVEHMRKHVNVYSGSVVRGGGHWDLAVRVLNNKEREFGVILGWIGVDGALLKPVIASKTEDLVDLLPMGKYPEQTTTVVADTPKADGSQAVDRFSEPLTAIAGDPDLSEAGVTLLRTAVEKTVATFPASMGADADGAADLRRFLQLPSVSKCRLWKKEFGAYPRGEWRRASRGKQPERVRGLRGVWAAKVRAHCRRLLKPLRVEGLWAWQSAARAIGAAGVPVQSGTVPVERLWECLKGMPPRGARTVSLRWFNVLSQLAFLRFNYRHYGTGCLPPWAVRDALLAQRLEAVVMLGVELEDDDGLDHLKHLFAPFL